MHKTRSLFVVVVGIVVLILAVATPRPLVGMAAFGAIFGGMAIVTGLLTYVLSPRLTVAEHKSRIDALEARIAHLESKTIKPPKS